MLTMTIKQAKAGFFNSAELRQAIDAGKQKALARGGAIVMRSARKSIKDPGRIRLAEMTAEERKAFRRRQAIAAYYGKPKPRKPRRRATSRPGQPPLNQTGLLRRWILFAYDRDRESVVIGPAKINRPTMAPSVLEYGGTGIIETRKDGKAVTLRARIAARPYMNPALRREASKLPDKWRNAISR